MGAHCSGTLSFIGIDYMIFFLIEAYLNSIRYGIGIKKGSWTELGCSRIGRLSNTYVCLDKNVYLSLF